MVDSETGILHACLIDGDGGGRDLEVAGPGAAEAEGKILWLHRDRKHPETKRWMREDSGLDPLVCEAMIAEETRPRCFPAPGGFVAILRGVNLNPNSDPEDMVSVRMWIGPERIITLRGPRTMAVEDIHGELLQGVGPRNGWDLLVALASKLIDRMGPVLDDLNDEVDALEEQVIEGEAAPLRHQLGKLRRQAITLRRYLSPQREALSRLMTEQFDGLTDLHRARVRESQDRLMRYIEDLDAIRERAAVTQEELAGRLSEQMNSRMYVLSVAAGIFLPLGLLTGLLGINVGGIPGVDSEWGFWIVCGVLIALTFLGFWILRRFRFI